MTNTIKMPKNGIKINEENKDFIESYLKAVAKNSIIANCSFENVLKIAEDAEAKLNATLLNEVQKNTVDVEGGVQPSIYLKRSNDGWSLVFADNYCRKNAENGKASLRFSSDMIAEFKKQYGRSSTKNFIKLADYI